MSSPYHVCPNVAVFAARNAVTLIVGETHLTVSVEDAKEVIAGIENAIVEANRHEAHQQTEAFLAMLEAQEADQCDRCGAPLMPKTHTRVSTCDTNCPDCEPK